MNRVNTVSVSDFLCVLLFMATGGLILLGSMSLPGPEYDPLGPAGAPQYIAYIMLFLSSLKLISLIRSMKRFSLSQNVEARKRGQYAIAIVFFISFFIYLLLLNIGGFSFSMVTFAFLVLSGFSLMNFNVSKLPLIVAVSVVLSFGLTYIFADILNVVLPD